MRGEKLDLVPLDGHQIGLPQKPDVAKGDYREAHQVEKGQTLRAVKPEIEKATNV
jgi:hypothetical protein